MGGVKARVSAVKNAALTIFLLSICAFVLILVGVAAAVTALYLGLEPKIGDYQAALLLCVLLLAVAACFGLLAMRKVKKAFKGNPNTIQSAASTQPGGGVAQPSAASAPGNPMQSVLQTLQSPAVITAVLVGVLVGRRMMKKD